MTQSFPRPLRVTKPSDITAQFPVLKSQTSNSLNLLHTDEDAWATMVAV